MDLEEFRRALATVRRAPPSARALAAMAHEQLCAADFPLLSPPELAAPAATALAAHFLAGLSSSAAEDAAAFPATRLLARNAALLSSAAQRGSADAAALSALCAAILRRACAAIAGARPLFVSPSSAAAAAASSAALVDGDKPTAAAEAEDEDPGEDEFLPFDECNGACFAVGASAEEAAAASDKEEDGEEEEEETALLLGIICNVAVADALAAEQSDGGEQTLEAALCAIAALLLRKRKKQTRASSAALAALAFCVRDIACAGPADAAPALLARLLDALSSSSSEDGDGENELQLDVLAGACSALPGVLLPLAADRIGIAVRTLKRGGCSTREVEAIAELIDAVCAAGGATSLHNAGLLSAAFEAHTSLHACPQTLLSAAVAACARSRPAFDAAATAGVNVQNSLPWLLMRACSATAGDAGSVAAEKLESARWEELDPALAHLSQMAACWQGFEMPGAVRDALEHVLARCPSPMPTTPLALPPPREDEEEDEELSNPAAAEEHAKQTQHTARVRRAISALLHPNKRE